MATFKSVSHAKKSMTIAKGNIDRIINADLEPVPEDERSLDLWFSTIGKHPEYLEKKYLLEKYERNYLDAEIYLMYSKPVSKRCNHLFDTCS